MKSRLLARRYAKAFIDRAEEASCESLLLERKTFQKIFTENEKLVELLSSRFVKTDEKKAIIDDLIKDTDNRELWQGLFNTILQKNRERIIIAVLLEIEKFLLERLNTVKMVVRVAREQRAETIDKIKKHYEKKLEKKIIIETEIHPDIIGGFVVLIGNTRVDGSVKHALDMFKKTKTAQAIE